MRNKDLSRHYQRVRARWNERGDCKSERAGIIRDKNPAKPAKYERGACSVKGYLMLQTFYADGVIT